MRRRWRRASDTDHWANSDSYRPEWDERTQLLAERIPVGVSVYDLGAGRQTLRQLLAGSCDYRPVDLVRFSDDVIVCDFNSRAPLPDLTGDWAVVSGLLEYVVDVRRLLTWAASCFSSIALSYVVAEGQYASRVERRRLGWVNDLNSAGLLRLVEQAGFEVRATGQHAGQILVWADRIP